MDEFVELSEEEDGDVDWLMESAEGVRELMLEEWGMKAEKSAGVGGQ